MPNYVRPPGQNGSVKNRVFCPLPFLITYPKHWTIFRDFSHPLGATHPLHSPCFPPSVCWPRSDFPPLRPHPSGDTPPSTPCLGGLCPYPCDIIVVLACARGPRNKKKTRKSVGKVRERRYRGTKSCTNPKVESTVRTYNTCPWSGAQRAQRGGGI